MIFVRRFNDAVAERKVQTKIKKHANQIRLQLPIVQFWDRNVNKNRIMDHMMMQFSFKGQRLFPDANNNGKRGSREGGRNADKYQLRPRGRTSRESRTTGSSATGPNSDSRARPSSRPRSAPLSKYRRKTANARERSRMREINQAFEALRRCVPHWASAPSNNSNNQGEKLTKITTLRLAMRYIGSLTAALRDPPQFSADLEMLLDSDESRHTCSPQTLQGSEASLSPDMGLPDSPFLSSPESYSPMLTSPDLPETCLEPLDFDSPSLLQDAFADPSITVETFSDYFLT